MASKNFVIEESRFNTRYEWIENALLEVKLQAPEDFLKVKETLTRIGLTSRNEHNTLFQTCHILHKKIPIDLSDMTNRESRYYICHFKELYVLDGEKNNLEDEDIIRRNKIASMLHDWKLVTIVNPHLIKLTEKEVVNLKILSFNDKKNWILKPKYLIGYRKK